MLSFPNTAVFHSPPSLTHTHIIKHKYIQQSVYFAGVHVMGCHPSGWNRYSYLKVKLGWTLVGCMSGLRISFIILKQGHL